MMEKLYQRSPVNALFQAKNSDVKIIDSAGILRQECLQKIMSTIGRNFLANQAEGSPNAMNMHFYIWLHVVNYRVRLQGAILAV